MSNINFPCLVFVEVSICTTTNIVGAMLILRLEGETRATHTILMPDTVGHMPDIVICVIYSAASLLKTSLSVLTCLSC